MSDEIKPDIDEDFLLRSLADCIGVENGVPYLRYGMARSVLGDLFAQSAENDRLAEELKDAADQIRQSMEEQQATNEQLQQTRRERDEARAQLDTLRGGMTAKMEGQT